MSIYFMLSIIAACILVLCVCLWVTRPVPNERRRTLAEYRDELSRSE